MYYLQSRYYNPQVGTFLNADVYISTGQSVLGYNMFAYCGNSPVNRTDSTGHSWVAALLVTAIVGVCAVGLSGCSSKQSNVVNASSHDANRRPYTGEPGSTYTAPNGIQELLDQMVLRNTIMTMMTIEGRINIHMIPMVVIITIGRMVLEVLHTA